jgi:integrase/recombinase XerD
LTSPVVEVNQTGFPTFRAACEDFESSLAGKSPQTVRTYRKCLRRFEDFLAERGMKPDAVTTDALDEDALERFHTWLVRESGVESRASVATYVAGTRAFFRFLARRKWLSPQVSFEALKANVRDAMGRGTYRTPRIDRRLPLIVTYVESLPLPERGPRTDRLRLELLRDKALIRTLFCTGIRRQEASTLNRADLDDGWSTQALITGKGSKERVIFFDEDTLGAIRAYLDERNDPYEPIFTRHDRGRGKARHNGANFRLSPLSVWRTVKRYAGQAGVRATTHDFRHAKASTLLNRGAKLSEVQDILGHASPETTKRIYAHYEVSHLREAFDRFSASAEELAGALGERSRRQTAAEPS